MRKIILSLSFAFLVLTGLSAQEIGLRKGDCTPDLTAADDVAAARAIGRRKLPPINNTWNPDKVYRQLVILLSYSDTDFQMENPKETYNRIFNEGGYNQRDGVGCVADYFRDQSGGMFNLQFDVFGPYKVSSKAQPITNPTENTRNYGREPMMEATRMMLAENPNHDFTPYDWNNTGSINQVIYISAGYAGNQSREFCYGYIWPNTSTFSAITTHDGKKISNYTCSCELWDNNSSCGIGTICHEYTHSLGLPDIYPTSSDAGYSVCDEWDLMDGGNFTNYGWCPPNYTSMEKWLLGWIEPIELADPASIRDMKPVAEGGDVYKITHSDSEFLLLENRQQRGWDFGAPGKGLVVYHVYYDRSVWSNNSVNNNANKRRFELVHADNMDYDDWNTLLMEKYSARIISSQYVNKPRLNSYYLSSSPYPWSTDTTTFVNNQLTDNSVPPVKMNYPNLEGKIKLEKPITNIQMSEEGFISFDFMGGGSLTGIVENRPLTDSRRGEVYDLNGRRISAAGSNGIWLIRKSDGTVRKIFK